MRAFFAMFLAGCTTGPGTGFATLAAVELDAGFAPEVARDLGDGWFLVDSGARMRLDAFAAEVGRVALQELEGRGGAFDPASPPPGYTLCHGGHCHSDEGRLVDYADIEAELAGEGARFADVAWAAVGSLDLLAGEALELGRVEPSPELPAADLTRVALQDVRIALAWEATGGPLDGVVTGSAELAMTSLTEGFELAVDRDTDPRLRVGISWTPGAALFDDMDPAAMDADELAARLQERGLDVEVR